MRKEICEQKYQRCSPNVFSQIFIVTEQEILVEMSTCWEAIKSLYGAYFAFNIEYPKSSLAFLTFGQFYILGIQDNQKIPTLAVCVKSTLDQLL
ncbi:hypothetical protein EMCRGX_G023353 [Ephydatia muelleri]